ncbi:MAG TPA: copper resistance protein CopC [Dehalococcoidia bacterium]|nr:copper resistance protein CopC [Dehalococcoidia bacterium]
MTGMISWRRRAGRSAAVGLALLLCAFALPAARPALAHAIFVSAAPAPGSQLRSAPGQLRIEFSEPLNAGQSGVTVSGSSGRPVTDRPSGVDPANNRALVLPLPVLAPGVYTVDWHTVSLVDGHLRRGVYSFTVLNADGSAPAAAAPRPPAQPLQLPGAAGAGFRWLALAGVFLIGGGVLVGLLAPGDLALRTLQRRMLLAGCCLLVLGGAGELFGAWLPFGGAAAAGDVLRSRIGTWWIVRAVAAIGLPLLAMPRRRNLPRWLERWLAPLLVGVVAAGFAATSHGAASARPWWGAAFDFVHLLGAAVWIGGVLMLALAFAMPRGALRTELRPLVKRFSLVAGAAVPLVLLSGVASASIELHDPGDLLRGGYGRALLLKLLLVGAALCVAGANALVLRRAYLDKRPSARRFRWAVPAEAIAGLAVLIPVAALTVFAPSRAVDRAQAAAERYARDPNPPASFNASLRLGSHAATFSLTPATIGVNAARLEAEGAADSAGATLRLTAPNGHVIVATLAPAGIESGGNAILEGTVQLNGTAGGWHASLLLPGAGSAILPLSVAPAERAASASGPDRGWLLALACLALAAALLALIRVRPARIFRFAVTGAGGGLIAAALVAGVVTAMQASGSAGAASWGDVARVQPQTTGGATSWAIPTPHAGLMTPAVGPDGDVWIGEMDTNKLARLDPVRNAVQEYTFGGGYQGTMGVAVDGGNRVWLAQQSAGVLGLFDPASGAYQAFAPPTPHAAPSGIAIGPDSAVWLTEMNVDRLARFDPAVRTFREYPLPRSGVVPYWLAVAPDGRVWFSELSGLRIGVLDPAGGAVREWAVPGGQHPAGIAAAPNGTVWFATTEGSLVRVDPASGAMTAYPTSEQNVYGVAVGTDGTVWVGSASADAVLAFGPASGRFVAHAVPHDSGPWWPAAGGDGSVWVALADQATGALARLQPPSGAPESAQLR